MFSLQNKIRFYIVVSIIIYIICTISIFLINVYINNSIGSLIAPLKEVNKFLNKIYIFVVTLSIFGVIYGIYVFFNSYLKGLNRYREIVKRVAGFSEQDVFDLKSIDFPSEDEFGNMGIEMNSIISKLQRFDDLKVQRIKVEEQKIEILAERMDLPVLVVKVDKNDKIVKYYNSKFEQIFARKKDKEDQFYDLKNFFLKALIVQEEKPVESQTHNPFKGVLDAFNAISEGELIYSFIDKEFEDAINIAIADRNITTIKKNVRTIRGDEVWHSEKIEIIPAWNDYGKTLDVIILFHNLKKK